MQGSHDYGSELGNGCGSAHPGRKDWAAWIAKENATGGGGDQETKKIDDSG